MCIITNIPLANAIRFMLEYNYQIITNRKRVIILVKHDRLLFKLVFTYAILIFTILGATFAFVSYNYSKFIFDEKENVYEQKLDIISEQLNSDIERIYTLHSQMIASPELNALITSHTDGTALTKRILTNFRQSYIGIKAIYLHDQNGKILDFAADSLAQAPDSAGLQDFIAKKAYRQFSLQNDNLIYYGSYYLADKSNFHYAGYLTIILSPQRMFYNTHNKAQEAFDSIYLINKSSGTIIAEYGDPLPDKDLFQADKNAMIRDGTDTYKLFRQRNSSYSEWELAVSVRYNVYSREIWHLTTMLFLLAVLAMTLIIMISYFTSKKITNPILLITRAMVQVENGIYPPPLPSHTTDETNDLILGFNHMVANLKKLNEDIIREQEEKRRYEVEKVKTQLELLQSQINPHFIHNTLNGLKYMALSNGNQELASTINSFNTLLRASISTSAELTTVEEECLYVTEYMNIQKMRYSSNQISCDFQIEPSASKSLLPRLILQPLVENSLFHGIFPLEGSRPGIITIKCFIAQDYLHVYISDNGIGIPKEKLQKINSGELRITNGYNHIGLCNVKERLNLMYQTDCNFTINSEYHSGTHIYFCVPHKEEESCIL